MNEYYLEIIQKGLSLDVSEDSRLYEFSGNVPIKIIKDEQYKDWILTPYYVCNALPELNSVVAKEAMPLTYDEETGKVVLPDSAFAKSGYIFISVSLADVSSKPYTVLYSGTVRIKINVTSGGYRLLKDSTIWEVAVLDYVDKYIKQNYTEKMQELMTQLQELVEKNKELVESVTTLQNNVNELIITLNQAENERISTENIRKENETNRISAENQRVADENARKETESQRVVNENRRNESEDQRITSENQRIEDENIRKENETNRISAENERISAENIRKENETNRISSENIRNESESQRVIDESNRKEAENQRKQLYDEVQQKLANGDFDGKTILHGKGLPSSELGNVGDVYINTSNTGEYSYGLFTKEESGWVYRWKTQGVDGTDTFPIFGTMFLPENQEIPVGYEEIQDDSYYIPADFVGSNENSKLLNTKLTEIDNKIESINTQGTAVGDTLPIGSVFYFEGTEEEIPVGFEKVDIIPYKQLLINNEFQINQRKRYNQTIGETQYCFDMWKMRTTPNISVTTTELEGGGIRIESIGSETTDMRLSQIIQSSDKKRICIIKIKSINGEVFATSFNEDNGSSFTEHSLELGVNSFIVEGHRTGVGVVCRGNCTVEIEYIDLFEGEIARPHIKETYEEALNRCLPYIERISGTFSAVTWAVSTIRTVLFGVNFSKKKTNEFNIINGACSVRSTNNYGLMSYRVNSVERETSDNDSAVIKMVFGEGAEFPPEGYPCFVTGWFIITCEP